MPGLSHNSERTALVALLPTAALAAAVFSLAQPALAGGCTTGSGESSGQVDRRLVGLIVSELWDALALPVVSLTCPAGGDPHAGVVCTGWYLRAGATEPLTVDVEGVTEDGQPRWMPRGLVKMEYQIARDFVASVRVPSARVRCPAGADVKAGFRCQVELGDGSTAAVDITAGDRDGRFAWRAHDVLQLDLVEAHIRQALIEDGRPGLVDCGRVVQRSLTGRSFDCNIRLASGEQSSATVEVVDEQGHIQYRLAGQQPGGRSARRSTTRRPASRAPSAGTAQPAPPAARPAPSTPPAPGSQSK
ncbi:MAG: hypothetical protein AAGC55_22295 [Myxococcota bacterium]